MGNSKETARLKKMISEAIMTLCQSSVSFRKKINIQGLVGVTVDDDDIFLINFDKDHFSKDLPKESQKDVRVDPSSSGRPQRNKRASTSKEFEYNSPQSSKKAKGSAASAHVVMVSTKDAELAPPVPLFTIKNVGSTSTIGDNPVLGVVMECSPGSPSTPQNDDFTNDQGSRRKMFYDVDEMEADENEAENKYAVEIKEEALDEPIPGPSNEGNNDPDWTPQGADAEKESTKDHNLSPDRKKQRRSSEKSSRKFRTIAEKYEIIKTIELNPTDKKHRQNVKAVYDISGSTFSDILSKKDEIIQAYEQAGQHKRRSCHLTSSFRDPAREIIDKELMDWFQSDIKDPDFLPSQKDLVERANMIAGQLGLETELDLGWVARWKDRHGFVKKHTKRRLKEKTNVETDPAKDPHPLQLVLSDKQTNAIFDKIDFDLLQWFTDRANSNDPANLSNNEELIKTANDIAKTWGLDNPVDASWIYKWKKNHNINDV